MFAAAAVRSRSRFIRNTYNSHAGAILPGRFNKLFSTDIGSRLEGKVALITGAADGIGKVTATKFINNGAKVVIADIDKNLGHETATALGPNASFISCDVANETDVSNGVDFTVNKHGKLDIMYNNAGIACHTPRSITELDLASFDRVMTINVRGVVAGIKHASRVMIPQSKGCILCTASITGVMAGLAQLTYSTSKATVIAIVRSAAAELCSHGVRVNAVSPNAIPTSFVMKSMRGYFPDLDDEQLVKKLYGTGSLEGAFCEPADVANAALYLASDDAKYISGHNLIVDGGFTSFKNLNFERN